MGKRSNKGIWTMGVVLLLAAGLSGCGKASKVEESSVQPPVQTEKTTETAAPISTVRKVKDMKGEIEVPVKPLQVVDISGSTAEVLLLGGKLVGTANQDDYKPGEVPGYLKDQLNGVQVVGNYAKGEVNMEQIVSLRPDLIISSAMFDKVYDQLLKIAPVYVINEDPLTFAGWKDRLVQIGNLFGEEAKAAAWQAEYDAKTKKLSEQIQAKTGKDSFAVVVAFPKNFSVFSNTGLGDMIFNDLQLPRSEGTPAEGWGATLTLEGLTAIKADHIFLQYVEGMEDELAQSEVWKSLKAVKQNQVYLLNNKDYYGMSFSPIGKNMLLDKISELILSSK